MYRQLGLFLLCPSLAWCAEAAGGDPLVSPPPGEIVAAAPLVKVAEFRLREARFAAAAVAQGDYLYVLGGSNDDNWVLDSVERLDCRTGVSEPFARLERGRLWHRAVVAGNTIYVLGGETKTVDVQGQPTLTTVDTVELIDLTTRKVSRGPALPEPRRSFACVLWNGKIHVVGGCLRSGAKEIRKNTHFLFDVKTRRWSSGAPMPTARESEAAVVDDALIVVAGGYDGDSALVTVEGFNPRDGSWRALPPLCRPASGHAVAHLGHHLFLFGHYDEPGQCLTYDLSTRRSEAISVAYKGGRHPATVVHQGRIYVIGGRGDETPGVLDLVQVFAPRETQRERGAPQRKP